MPFVTTPTQESLGVVSFDVLVNDKKLQGPFGASLQSLEVESTYNRPDMCLAIFAVSEVSAEKPLPKIEPGAPFEIRVRRKSEVQSIFNGEVSSVELESRYGHTEFVLRSYDKRQRLYRGLTTATYEKKKHSELISEVVKRNKLDLTIGGAGSVMPYAVQAAMADGDYVEQLLHELGYVMVRDGESFVAKALGDFKDKVAVLEFGNNLDSYTFRTTSDSWVGAVQVHDWDPIKKEAVTGKSSEPAGLVGDQSADAGQPMGDATAYRPGLAVDTTGADAMATAARERMLVTSRQLDGTCDGNEKMVPGGIVTVKGIDDTFNGDYRLSSVRLRWEVDEGFTTNFSCNSAGEHSITETLSRAADGGAATDQFGDRIWGVVPAIVTKNEDPEGLGRLLVEYPWLPNATGGRVTSDWVRVAVPGGGTDQKGLYLVHEAQDEVVVAFEHGDPRRGYVLGGLYNNKDKPPIANADAVKNGKTPQKGFRSSTGHQLTFNDSSDKPGIELVTADKNITLKLEESSGAVTFTTKKGGSTVTISAHGDVSIKSETGGLTIEAMKDITMKATGNIKLEATQNVDIKAQVNATVEAGVNATVKGTVNAELSGDVMASVAGKMVKIN